MTSLHETDFLEALLKKYKLWEKKSPFGEKSLLNAISNAIYLTGLQTNLLHKKLLAFFFANLTFYSKLFNFNELFSIQTFARNICLPQYQNFVLELSAKFLKRKIDLYYIQEDGFQIISFGNNEHKTIRIIRIYDSHYSALFTIDLKIKFTIAQNIVLNIVEASFSRNKKEFKIANLNRDDFQNYEYQKWLETSMSNEYFCLPNIEKSLKIDSQQPILQDFEHLKKYTEDNIGIKIVNSIHERRKNGSSVSSADNTLEFMNDCEEFLKQLEKKARKKKLEVILSKSPWFSASQIERKDTVSDGMAEPSDSFSYQDFEELLYRQNKPKALKLNWTNKQSNQNYPNQLKTSAYSSDSLVHKTDNKDEFFNLPFPASSAEELITKKIDRIKNVDDSEYEEFVPISQIRAETEKNFKKPLKSSISENFYIKQKKETPEMFNYDFIQPLPSFDEEIPANFDPNAVKTAKKKKKQSTSESKWYRGFLKFFDEKNSFGFMSATINGKPEDVFVYRNEFDQAGIDMSTVRLAKHGTTLTFEFNVAFYFGKYQKSKKALNLKLVEIVRPHTE